MGPLLEAMVEAAEKDEEDATRAECGECVKHAMLLL